jgi:hypothetical protein
MLDQIAQLSIFFTGVVGMYLVGSADPKMRMYAGILGLCAQPFWFYTTLANGQIGITILSFIYAYNWFRVFNNNRKLTNNA